jgi:phosphomevalonate kinase
VCSSDLETKIKKCENKLKKINYKINNIKLNDKSDNINQDVQEFPMPLSYNLITHKNYENEKSIIYTQKLIKKLKERETNRSNKEIDNLIEKFNNIVIKKEVNVDTYLKNIEVNTFQNNKVNTYINNIYLPQNTINTVSSGNIVEEHSFGNIVEEELEIPPLEYC